MAEKSTYTGPWQVPWKRAKKDPSAPKVKDSASHCVSWFSCFWHDDCILTRVPGNAFLFF